MCACVYMRVCVHVGKVGGKGGLKKCEQSQICDYVSMEILLVFSIKF